MRRVAALRATTITLGLGLGLVLSAPGRALAQDEPAIDEAPSAIEPDPAPDPAPAPAPAPPAAPTPTPTPDEDTGVGEAQVQAEPTEGPGDPTAAATDQITAVEPGAADLATMMETAMSREEFRQLVELARRKVLARLEARMAAKQAARMATISTWITRISLLGLLLLATPLVLRRRYPGQGARLLKFSALAALTFVVTVNLFGAVVVGMREVQGALGRQTNPQLRVAEGFFAALHRNADQYRPMAHQLFAPTLAGLEQGGDAQPAAVLIENGTRLLRDARAFTAIATVFKKVDVAFALIPIVLLGVTLVLFVLAIKPTLIEIITMPARMAAGTQGSALATIRLALRRLGGEVVATGGTLLALVGLTVLSALALGQLLPLAVDSLIQFFGTAVLYLQVEPAASSGVVFVSLLGVVLFLVLNLAAIVLSGAFFLGKLQKILQARCNGGVALSSHARFWRRGVASLLVAQLVPVVFMVAGWKVVDWFATRMIGDGSAIRWKSILVGGPAILVLGFVLVFWAARGLAGLTLLARYKVAPAPGPTPAPRAHPLVRPEPAAGPPQSIRG
jgi:hypothetical protein